MARMVQGIATRLNAVVELEHDTVAALSSACKRIGQLADKVRLGEIAAANRRHAAELAEIVRAYGGTPTEHGDTRRLFLRARMLLGAQLGEASIFAAVASVEATASQRCLLAASLPDMPSHVGDLLVRITEDHERHRAWLVARATRDAKAPQPTARR